MKICVVTDNRKNFSVRLPACDVALFGFAPLGQVEYESELSGKSDKFERLAKFSGSSSCGVLCGCITDSRGLVRKSVAVAAYGKLLGITDMMYALDGDAYKSGANVGIYSVGGYKVGLCVGNDLFFPEHVKTLSLCGCNLICAHSDDLSDGMAPVLVRAYAYLYGMPFALCGGGAAYFADVTGVIASSNQPVAVFESSPKNCYRTATVRRRGLLCGGEADY